MPVAVLLPPLRHRALGVELHFAIPLGALCSAVHQQTNIGHLSLFPYIEHCGTVQADARAADSSVESGINAARATTGCSRGRAVMLQQHASQGATPAESTSGSLQSKYCGTDSDSNVPEPQMETVLPHACTAGHHWQRDSEAAAGDAAARATVLVQCGGSWASGVILDAEAGIIVTNAHAVPPGRKVTVRAPPSVHMVPTS
jgi:S1-C subfamily serine protease